MKKAFFAGILLCILLLTTAAWAEDCQHDYQDHLCINCGMKEAGLYWQGEYRMTWQDLLDRGFITVKSNSITHVQDSLQGDLVIEEGIEDIGREAFNDVMLRSVTTPTTLKSMQYAAFYRAKMEEIKLNEGLTTLRYGIFWDCSNLKEIHIPSSVKEMDASCFSGCTSLETVTMDPESTIKLEGGFHFAGCASLKIVTFAKIKGITDHMFDRCTALEEFTVPDGLSFVGKNAFQYCTALKKVYIPDSVTGYGMAAFRGCTALEEIRMSNNVREIPKEMFVDCTALTSVYLGDSVEKAKSPSFSHSTTEVYLPKSIIDLDQFWGWAYSIDPENLKVYYAGDEFEWMLINKRQCFYNPDIVYNWVPEAE